jgi:hypothetical protein
MRCRALPRATSAGAACSSARRRSRCRAAEPVPAARGAAGLPLLSRRLPRSFPRFVDLRSLGLGTGGRATAPLDWVGKSPSRRQTESGAQRAPGTRGEPMATRTRAPRVAAHPSRATRERGRPPQRRAVRVPFLPSLGPDRGRCRALQAPGSGRQATGDRDQESPTSRTSTSGSVSCAS